MSRRSKRPTRRIVDGYRIVVDDETSARMGRVRQKGTKPELIVRGLIYELGHRYRVENRDLPGSPDIANRRRGWAVFVHGCYWHRHRGCLMATTPRRNRAFWEVKFAANQARDRRALRQLRGLGYHTLVVWECQTKRPVALRRRLARWFAQQEAG
jgi:DNA mismatch endonuclease (patch repair protein)